MFGPALAPGEEAARLTGVDAVLPREEFATHRRLRCARPHYLTPFRPEVLGSQSSGDPAALWRAARQRIRGTAGARARRSFVDKLKAAAPGAELRDLDAIARRHARGEEPARDRGHPRGDALAGLGIMEAMRDARPGMTRVRAAGGRRVRVQEGRRLRACLLRAGRRPAPTPTTRTITGTPPMLAGRRSRAVRLRARLQVLPVRRDARLPRERQVHPRQREFYTIYLRLYQRAHDIHRGSRVASEGRRHRGGEDGRQSWRRFRSPTRDPGCSRAVRRSVPRRARVCADSGTTSAWKCTTSAGCRPRPSSPAWSSPSSRRCSIEAERLGQSGSRT